MVVEWKGFKVQKVIKLRRSCNLCGKPAVIDTPTRLGPWGHLCEDCGHKYAVNTSIRTGLDGSDK